MRKEIVGLFLGLTLVLTGCGVATNDSGTTANDKETNTADSGSQVVEETAMSKLNESDGVEARNRTYYEAFVYSFADSNGDGIGDLAGIDDKLDYITGDEGLGMSGIWLSPIMPSNSYHKYDVLDYKAIDIDYGTMDDFDKLMKDCDDRDVNVLVDLIMNHTSADHPWFVAATDYLKQLGDGEVNLEDCPYVDYYNFSRDKVNGTYAKVEGTDWYYEAVFWDQMPDLNLYSEGVRAEFASIVDFWLAKGVDGFRLDGAKEYVSGSTSQNIEILTWFNNMVKEKKSDAYIVGEVWSDRGTYTKYYESGIDSCFDFAFGDSTGIIANTVRQMDGYNASSYGAAVQQIQEELAPYGEGAVDAPFYTNHDMGRSAGYYSGDTGEPRTKIAGALNLFMSGDAFVYYGEELGMKGSGKDENKRSPMRWTSQVTDESNSEEASSNTEGLGEFQGMCTGPANMDTLKQKYEALDKQKYDGYSIYNYYRQAMILRNRFPEIAQGQVEFQKEASDENLCVLKKTYEGSSVWIYMNISQEEQTLTPEPGTKLVGMLQTDNQAAVETDGEVSLPAYGIVVYQ